ncbi:MAG: PspC domain-containing protein [Gammaproteobacteria bacterium]|nr:PspC domain-containing protein [Gammaproteobacteria bacterium]NNC97776.1 PspC domain-containing protein [Gammaproteobacteria bacterium]NNM14143.1 PspC domain-containing protein [Gammaproteobacteria bacterium]
MSRFDDDYRRPSPRTLYRDPKHGSLAGVFTGIADYLGLKKGPTQCVGIILCIMFPPMIVVYVILAFVLPVKPENLYASPSLEQMWRSYRRSPVGTVDEVKHRFRNMETRLQRMERYVTSKRYNLDRDFQDL